MAETKHPRNDAKGEEPPVIEYGPKSDKAINHRFWIVGGSVMLCLVVAAAVGVFYLERQKQQQPQELAPPRPAVAPVVKEVIPDTVTDSLKTLVDRMGALEKQIRQQGKATVQKPATTPMPVAGIETPEPLPTELPPLKQDTEEASPEPEVSINPRLLLLLRDIERQFEQGQISVESWTELERQLPADPSLQAQIQQLLESSLRNPAVSVTTLQEQYADKVPALIRVVRNYPEGWVGNLRRWLDRQFLIYKTETTAEGSRDEANILYAEKLLKEQKLPDAVAVIRSFPDTLQPLLSDWQQAAGQQLAIRQRLERLFDTVRTLLERDNKEPVS